MANDRSLSQSQHANDSDKNSRLFTTVIFISAFVIAFVFYSRLRYRSPYLYSWDSVQFALSIEKFDVRLHQPHPPGYIFFSLTLRFVNWIVRDVNLAFVLLNIFATIGTCAFIGAMIWKFTSDQSLERRLLCAFGGALLFLMNPLSWFYGSVAEIYVVESFFVSLICYFLVCSNGRPSSVLWASFFMAVAGGFRATTEVFLFPLYAVSIFRRPRRLVLLSLILLIPINLCWLLPTMYLSGGASEYMTLLKQQFLNSVRTETTPARWFQSESFKIFLLLIQAITIPIVAVLLLRIRSLRLKRDEVKLLVAILPALLFYLFVYFDKEGYLLFLVPPVIILAVVMLSRVIKRTMWIASLILCSVFLNYRIFVKPPYLGTADEINHAGETILARLTTPNRHMISGLALRFRKFKEALDQLGGSPRIFVVKGQYYPDWRLLMYYFPDDQVLLITPGVRRVRLARQHRSEMAKPPIKIESKASFIVTLSNDPPDIPMPFFRVEERNYYYSKISELPESFSIFHCTFQRSTQ